jgi:WD40 repeat protein
LSKEPTLVKPLVLLAFLWDPSGASPRAMCEHAAVLQFSPDGATLASASGPTLRLFDARTGQCRATLEAHVRPVNAFSFAAAAPVLAAGSEDATVSLWDVSTGIKQAQFHVGAAVTGVALTPDGKMLAVSDGYQTALWDLATRKKLKQLPVIAAQTGLVFAPGGRNLLAAPAPPPAPTNGNVRLAFREGPPQSASPLEIWDTETGKKFRQLEDSTEFGFMAAFAPDGRLVSATTPDGRVAVWETISGNKVLDDADIRGPVQWINFVGFAGKRTLLTARTHAAEPCTVQAWDVANARELARLEGRREKFETFAFAPNGDRLAVSTPKNGLQLRTGLKVPALSAGTEGKPNLEALWSDLASLDARRGYRALWTLANTDEGVALVAARLQLVTRPDLEHIKQLLSRMSDGRYAVREQAMRDLEASAELIQPVLAKALRQGLPLEARRRVELILTRLENRPVVATQVRALRGVAVLEYRGTPHARAVLRRLANGVPEALLTREAAAALARLEHP